MRVLQVEGSGSREATLCKKSRLVFAKSLSFRGDWGVPARSPSSAHQPTPDWLA